MRRPPIPLLLVLLLSGCYLSRSADLPDELGRTWRGATVAVPFSAVDPALADVTGRMAEVEDRLQAARPAARLPVVVFLHGCNGLHPGYRVDLGFLRAQGYAVVAPDSFARDYKPRSCDRHSKTGGFHPGVIGFRLAETAHALERVRAFPWVDPDRIVLMGQSEGGITTANWEGDGLAGRVILGWTCQIPWPPLWGLRGDPRDPGAVGGQPRRPVVRAVVRRRRLRHRHGRVRRRPFGGAGRLDPPCAAAARGAAGGGGFPGPGRAYPGGARPG